MRNEIFVQWKILPSRVAAFTKVMPDGSYVITINITKDLPTQIKGYRHEMKHIENGDFDKHQSVDTIELITHRGEVS